MSDRKDVIDRLQTALSMELAAVEQYLLHAHVAEDWGLDRLAAKMREEMQEELGHAQAFTRRIMFLKGDPIVKSAKTPQRAQTLKDMFAADLDDEKEAIRFYTEAAQTASAVGDIGSRKLFENIALDEEGHMDWLEMQLAHIERLGEPVYMSMQIAPEGEGSAEA
jgi:bacterioferritin